MNKPKSVIPSLAYFVKNASFASLTVCLIFAAVASLALASVPAPPSEPAESSLPSNTQVSAQPAWEECHTFYVFQYLSSGAQGPDVPYVPSDAFLNAVLGLQKYHEFTVSSSGSSNYQIGFTVSLKPQVLNHHTQMHHAEQHFQKIYQIFSSMPNVAISCVVAGSVSQDQAPQAPQPVQAPRPTATPTVGGVTISN